MAGTSDVAYAAGYVMVSTSTLAVVREAVRKARNHSMITCRERCLPEMEAALSLLDIALGEAPGSADRSEP